MRRVAQGLAVLLASVAAVSAASPSANDIKRAFRLVQLGDASLARGDPRRARVSFESALAAAPGLPEALVGLGHVAMREQSFTEALHRYEQARDGFSAYDEVIARYRRQRYVRSQAEIQEIRDKIHVLQQPATSRGDAAYQISRLENEASRLESATPPSLDSESAPPGELSFFIGNALYRLDRRDEAIAAWLACRERSPRFAPVENNLAVAYWLRGNKQAAIEHARGAARLGFPLNPQFKRDLGLED